MVRLSIGLRITIGTLLVCFSGAVIRISLWAKRYNSELIAFRSIASSTRVQRNDDSIVCLSGCPHLVAHEAWCGPSWLESTLNNLKIPFCYRIVTITVVNPDIHPGVLRKAKNFEFLKKIQFLHRRHDDTEYAILQRAVPQARVSWLFNDSKDLNGTVLPPFSEFSLTATEK